MDNVVLESLPYFEGSGDATFLEIRVWRATIYSLIEAHKSYSEQLIDAMKIMREFLEEELSKMTSCCSKTAMDQLLDIVSRIASVHTQVWEEFCDNSRPYMELVELDEVSYNQLKKKSSDQWNKHLELEQMSENENKSYQKHLQRWRILHDRVSKLMTPRYQPNDTAFTSMTGKVDIALTKYQSHFRKEVKHRQVLAQQTAEIKHEFVTREKERLGLLFDTLADLQSTIEKITPKSIDVLDELQLSLGDVNTEELAVLGWESNLKSYTFSKYQGPDGTDPNEQSQPILRDGDFKKRKKSPPLNVFAAVAKDNFLKAEDINKKPSVVRSKSDDSKTDPVGQRHILRKQSSTTPAPEDTADNEEEDESDNLDPARPNLSPLDLDDDVSISDSLKNCAMVCEDESIKSKKKITFSDTVSKENKRSDESVVNGISCLEAPMCTVGGGSYNVLHKLWNPQDQHPTKTANNKHEKKSKRQEYPVNKSGKTKSDEVTEGEQLEAKSPKSMVSPVLDNRQKVSSANPVPAISDTCKDGFSILKDMFSSQADETKHRHKLEDTSGFGKPKIPNSDITYSCDQPTTSQDQSCLKQQSEKNKKTDKKHSVFSEGSVEEIKMSKSLRIASRRESEKNPSPQQTNSLTGPTASEKNPVTVIVLKDRIKQNSKEITIRAGMKIKQTCGANKDGMAYGYKKTKYGLRKYGLYPSDLVTLYNTRAESVEN